MFKLVIFGGFTRGPSYLTLPLLTLTLRGKTKKITKARMKILAKCMERVYPQKETLLNFHFDLIMRKF